MTELPSSSGAFQSENTRDYDAEQTALLVGRIMPMVAAFL